MQEYEFDVIHSRKVSFWLNDYEFELKGIEALLAFIHTHAQEEEKTMWKFM